MKHHVTALGVLAWLGIILAGDLSAVGADTSDQEES